MVYSRQSENVVVLTLNADRISSELYIAASEQAMSVAQFYNKFLY
jgi:hypothetical protein